jgi:hypothetical protein
VVSEAEKALVLEAKRITSIRKGAHKWGWYVLQVRWQTADDLVDVKNAYKQMSRKFHPDKLARMSGQNTELFATAFDILGRARDACTEEHERKNYRPPSTVTGIRSEYLSTTPGDRVVNLSWNPVQCDPAVPLDKIKIEIHDPDFGKFLVLAYCD